jgi:2-polyprenyl-3-methyl-5-hydroxy-6-metoxy-1,4-benzoquinol methylase
VYKIHIDHPGAGEAVRPGQVFAGWTISPDPSESVAITVNGRPVGSQSILRPDVETARPGRNGKGFTFFFEPEPNINNYNINFRIGDAECGIAFSLGADDPSVAAETIRHDPRLLEQRTNIEISSIMDYEALYEAHARTLPPDQSIGGGDYVLIGRIQLGSLLMAGLRPGDTLLDFGCGTGRLAVHAIPWLQGGRYIGIDISETMLAHARVLIDEKVPSPPCSIEFVHQTTPEFSLPDKSVDMICAFSVFTHMEHEDTYRYLRAARRIIKDEGRFMYSCLPMEQANVHHIFLHEASLDVQARWSKVRNVTTSRGLMVSVARMAGWEPICWYSGEGHSIRLPDAPEMKQPGQAFCVLAPA